MYWLVPPERAGRKEGSAGNMILQSARLAVTDNTLETATMGTLCP